MPFLLFASELSDLCYFLSTSRAQQSSTSMCHAHSWPFFVGCAEYAAAWKTIPNARAEKLKNLFTSFYTQFASQRYCLLRGDPTSL